MMRLPNNPEEQLRKKYSMKHSFLVILYRQNKNHAILFVLWLSISNLLDILVFLSQKYPFLYWSIHPQSVTARMIASPSFWWMILLNFIPLILLCCIQQTYLIKAFVVWLLFANAYFILNHWFALDIYPTTMISTVLFSLFFIQFKKKTFMINAIKPK